MNKHEVVAGDVFEVPLGNYWFGYAVQVQHGVTAILDTVAEVRPPLASITKHAICGFFHSDWPDNGIWQLVGHDAELGKIVAPPHQFLGQVLENGVERKATEADSHLPYLRIFGERHIIRKICRHHGLPVPDQFLPKPSEDPICNAMSINFNDPAEQVRQVFDEELSKGMALRETEAYFRDDIKGDSDWEVPFWLVLAYLGLEYECLTERIRKKALKILDSESVFDVAWNWPEENKGQIQAYAERSFVVRQFRRRLQSLTRWW